MATKQNPSYVLVEHARGEKQREILEKINTDGVCPFCTENFLKYHTEPIIKETDSWIVTYNFNPYDGSRYHFLFVYKTSHIDKPRDMTPLARVELFDLVEELCQHYNIEGGSILMRFGDKKITGSSVHHLHAHLVVGESKDAGGDSLKVTLGYKKNS